MTLRNRRRTEVMLLLKTCSMSGASIVLLENCDGVGYVLICAACNAIVRPCCLANRHVMCVIHWPQRCPCGASSIVLPLAWALPTSNFASPISDNLVRWLRIIRLLFRFFAACYALVVRDDRVCWLERQCIVHVMITWGAEVSQRRVYMQLLLESVHYQAFCLHSIHVKLLASCLSECSRLCRGHSRHVFYVLCAWKR